MVSKTGDLAALALGTQTVLPLIGCGDKEENMA